MKRKNITGLYLVTTVILLGMVFNTFFRKPDIAKKIDDLRKESALSLDSFNKKLSAENRFFDSIQYLIDSRKLDRAANVINELLNTRPLDDKLHILKGQVFEARMQYDSAINEYNFVIFRIPYSNALDKRATLFIKLGRYQNAIEDYKKVYEVDSVYSYKIAQIFELIKEKDSALKYYHIYLKHYPDSILQKKINVLYKQ
jgi:tetratricopeptide (TPR) repeat protein